MPSKGAVTQRQHAEIGATPRATSDRLIDHWFPCAAVDESVGTSEGSGRSEKALFTWFASRPIAQARAAVLTTLLTEEEGVRADIERAVRGDKDSLERLAATLKRQYGSSSPIVLDMFSGRGIIPLEAARVGGLAVGIDISPVATLGGRLLADFPFRDWSHEPPLFLNRTRDSNNDQVGLEVGAEPRLLADVRLVIGEIGSRVRQALDQYFPKTPDGRRPWAYLWAVSITCDQCKRRFPLIGSLVLRHPYHRTSDPGQALKLVIDGDLFKTQVIEGAPTQAPTFGVAPGRKGKSGRCLFCRHVHSLDAIKRKGEARDYKDELMAVADGGDDARKTFRIPTPVEVSIAESIKIHKLSPIKRFSAVPDESIPPGNEDTIRASGYGYKTYGELLNPRQTLQFVETVRALRLLHSELVASGISVDYAAALACFAAANLQRRLRRSTRGAKLLCHGTPTGKEQNRVQAHDIFSDESKVSFQFDYIETGLDKGPGTWESVAEPGLNALKKIMLENRHGLPGKFWSASATALPYRDRTVHAVITDPPYLKMIDYLDASDLFFVWFKRALCDIVPDLFGGEDILQDKTDEIIVKRGNAPGEHRTKSFYEDMLSKAFRQALRVLREDGHLVVVFGHSDPDAWSRLLSALHTAGFVVTSAWPSRTESSSTDVASIKVTVTIGCRVAPNQRPSATSAQVDREVINAVKARVMEWDRDGLALNDQLMAAYGPAMEVYGRYKKVSRPDGSAPALEHYLSLARAAVREATALTLDELPLESFDATTRLAVFWLRLYGRSEVPKGEARFLAQADGLDIDDVRGRLLEEAKAGFRLRLDRPAKITRTISTFEVARALAAAWDSGGTESTATALVMAERDPGDAHLWAVVKEITARLPSSDPIAKSLSAITRNAATIGSLASAVASDSPAQDAQLSLDI